MIGSAMHTLWEEMLEWDNLRAKLRGEEEPWLIEQEVKIRPPAVPKGSHDVFHKPTGTVLDWKHLGSSSLMKISSKGPGDVYRTQLHTYGYGLEEMGYNVNTVVLFAIPRSPTWGVPFMHESVVWSEPYDRQLAVDALDRVEGLFKDAKRLNATANIMKLQTVKATPGDSCMFCPLNGMMEGKRRVCPESK
jgi:hypothetical protein